MKTFKEIADLAIEKGFINTDETDYYLMRFKRKDGINVVLSFPNDNLSSASLGEGVNIDWEYRLADSKTGKVIYKEWLDYYDGTADEKIVDMQEHIRRFIYKITFLQLRIVEHHGLKIFGKEFLKYKSLEFEENDGWTEY